MKVYIVSIIWALLVAGCATDKVAGTLTVSDSVIGGNFGPGDTPPALIKTVPPVYPYELRRKGIEGKVVVEFVVDTRGRVVSARVISSPNELLSESAVAAVRQFVFRPATRQGRLVNVRLSTPIEFHLEQKAPNQSADSTASAGTSAAGQPRVPASSAGHL
jgi:TonB family protein